MNTQNPELSDTGKSADGMPPTNGKPDVEKPKIANWMINVLGVIVFLSAVITGFLIFKFWPDKEEKNNKKGWNEVTNLVGPDSVCKEKIKNTNDSTAHNALVSNKATGASEEPKNKDSKDPACYCLKLTSEQRIIILVLLGGALGSFIHAASSFSNYVGEAKIEKSWVWWYLLRPPIGMSIALVFYLSFRGGLLNDTPIETLNIYGIMTLAALSGLFTDKATLKLEEIFQSLFKPADKRKGRLYTNGEGVSENEEAKG